MLAVIASSRATRKILGNTLCILDFPSCLFCFSKAHSRKLQNTNSGFLDYALFATREPYQQGLMVDEKLALELQQIIKEDYGIDLSVQEVSRFAYDWISVFDLLAKVNHRIKQNENDTAGV